MVRAGIRSGPSAVTAAVSVSLPASAPAPGRSPCRRAGVDVAAFSDGSMRSLARLQRTSCPGRRVGADTCRRVMGSAPSSTLIVTVALVDCPSRSLNGVHVGVLAGEAGRRRIGGLARTRLTLTVPWPGGVATATVDGLRLPRAHWRARRRWSVCLPWVTALLSCACGRTVIVYRLGELLAVRVRHCR